MTSDILVNQNNVVRVDAQLQVGAQTEKIQVTAEAALLQTDRADIHAEVATQVLENMPQATRTYEGLMGMVPGAVFATGQLGGGTNNPSKSMQFTFNGTGTNGAQVRIEGVSANNPWQYYNTSYVPSIEAIQNVNVATNANDSEQALSGGASVNVMLKSGTNETHGAAFAYNVNSKFEANNFFAPAGSKPPPAQRQQRRRKRRRPHHQEPAVLFRELRGRLFALREFGDYHFPAADAALGKSVGFQHSRSTIPIQAQLMGPEGRRSPGTSFPRAGSTQLSRRSSR